MTQNYGSNYTTFISPTTHRQNSAACHDAVLLRCGRNSEIGQAELLSS